MNLNWETKMENIRDIINSFKIYKVIFTFNYFYFLKIIIKSLIYIIIPNKYI